MDVGTLLGLLLAFGMIGASVFMGGGSVTAFWDLPSVLVVFGGTLGALLMCFPLATVKKLPRVLMRTLSPGPARPEQLVAQLVSLAETARRDGILALENRLAEIDDRFLRLGLQLAVDGARPELLEEVLRGEMEAMSLRHRDGRAILDQVGKFAPAFGMIGTLLGLIVLLGNMSDPSLIGGGMAVALITTLYGAVLANASFIPLAEKLANLSRQELFVQEITLRGVLAIQSGDTPRLIEQKLQSFLPPELRSPKGESRS